MDKGFRIRLGISFLVILGLCGAVVIRSGVLMLLPSKQLADTLAKQFRQAPKPEPRRGMILDRNREPLAVSLDVRSLYADPSKVRDVKTLAKSLARILGLPVAKVAQRLAMEDRGFVWIKRHLTKAEETRVRLLLDQDRQLHLVLGFARESKRFYPNKDLAAHVVGFTGTDSRGLEGLEYFYDADLSGKNSGPDAIEGKNLILTIEKGLQHTLEVELEKGVKSAGGTSGSAVVMDAETGEIWAMASWPTYNLNEFRDAKPEWRRNRVVTEPFEPGSTLKTLVVAGALEAAVVKPDAKFFCEDGKMQIGNRWIKESSLDREWKWLTVEEIIKYSSNIGATKIAYKLGKDGLYRTLLKQGIAQKTEIDLPGEASGSLARPATWSEVQFSNISFGQGLTATPLQIIRSFAAIVNGGFLVQPRVVSLREDPETLAGERTPVRMERILKLSTASEIRRMLISVTAEDGTAKRARIPGFEVAGKTGTSQVAKAGVGYASGEYVASFVGFPVDVKPSLVGLVVISEPEFANRFGGDAAAPVFQKVMNIALARAGVNPKFQETEPEMVLASSAPERAAAPVAEAAPVSPQDEAILRALGRLETFQEAELGKYTMPNLLGRSAREALDALSTKPLRLSIEGTGVIIEQSPKAGAVFQKGDLVRLKLDPAEAVYR